LQLIRIPAFSDSPTRLLLLDDRHCRCGSNRIRPQELACKSGSTAIALQVNAYLLVINTEHYCVMVIVRAAVWLFAPVPLVDAVRVTVLDPAGVPEFAGLLLLPHEARLTVNNARAQML
jgi:hypothetical protein